MTGLAESRIIATKSKLAVESIRKAISKGVAYRIAASISRQQMPPSKFEAGIKWKFINAAGVPFLSFAIPSTISIIPWATTSVYFGSLAKDIADIFDGQVPLRGTYSYNIYSLSGILMVLIVAYTTITSR